MSMSTLGIVVFTTIGAFFGEEMGTEYQLNPMTDTEIIAHFELDEKKQCEFYKSMFVTSMKLSRYDDAKGYLNKIGELKDFSAPVESNMYLCGNMSVPKNNYNLFNWSYQDFRSDFRYYSNFRKLKDLLDAGSVDEVTQKISKIAEYSGKNGSLGYMIAEMKRAVDLENPDLVLLGRLLGAPPYFSYIPPSQKKVIHLKKGKVKNSAEFSTEAFYICYAPVTIADFIVYGRETGGTIPGRCEYGDCKNYHVNAIFDPHKWNHTAIGASAEIMLNFCDWAGFDIPSKDEWISAYTDRAVIDSVFEYGDRFDRTMDSNCNSYGIPYYFGDCGQLVRIGPGRTKKDVMGMGGYSIGKYKVKYFYFRKDRGYIWLTDSFRYVCRISPSS